MIIIGCDYHPGFQQIAYANTDTGALSEVRLGHKEQAEQFYRELSQRSLTVRVGMEASGHARWFERLLNELQFEMWIGNAAAIRACMFGTNTCSCYGSYCSREYSALACWKMGIPGRHLSRA